MSKFRLLTGMFALMVLGACYLYIIANALPYRPDPMVLVTYMIYGIGATFTAGNLLDWIWHSGRKEAKK